MHWVMASLPPLMVTALSVELGSISLATWIELNVTFASWSTSHLDGGSCDLPDLLDLGSAFSDQGTALWGGHN